jgi:hypothetical protein
VVHHRRGDDDEPLHDITDEFAELTEFACTWAASSACSCAASAAGSHLSMTARMMAGTMSESAGDCEVRVCTRTSRLSLDLVSKASSSSQSPADSLTVPAIILAVMDQWLHAADAAHEQAELAAHVQANSVSRLNGRHYW